MSAELSVRARRMLESLERRAHVEDHAQVRAALRAVGAPVTEPVLEFHEAFAGYVYPVWGEDGVLGIIHPEPRWLAAMQAEAHRSRDGVWYLACADVHPSWEMTIDQFGRFYANGPDASSFFMRTEQNAFVWEFSRSHPLTYVPLWLGNTPEQLNAVLLPRLAGHRVASLSDEYCQFFASEEFVVTVRRGDYWEGWLVEGVTPAEFTGVSLGKERGRA